MITLSADEVALLRSILTALRAIKVRDIDKALVILSKLDRMEPKLPNQIQALIFKCS